MNSTHTPAGGRRLGPPLPLRTYLSYGAAGLVVGLLWLPAPERPLWEHLAREVAFLAVSLSIALLLSAHRARRDGAHPGGEPPWVALALTKLGIALGACLLTVGLRTQPGDPTLTVAVDIAIAIAVLGPLVHRRFRARR